MTTERKTAADVLAEAEALRLQEQQLEEAKFRSTYHHRLLKLVHAYVSEMPLYSVKATGDDKYEAFEFKTSLYSDVRLPVSMEHDDRTVDQLREDMEEAEHVLEVTRETQRKKLEQEVKKSAALAKLTKEERELLGL